MTWTRRAALLGLSSAAAPLAGCGAPRRYRVRYRMTARVRISGRVLEGSTVQEFRYRDAIKFLHSMDMSHADTYGEAIVLDAGGGRLIVFTLARSPKGRWLEKWTLPWAVPPHQLKGDLNAKIWRKIIGDGLDVPAEQMPAAVTFDDPANLESGRVLSPGDLSGLFGPDAAVESLTINATREAITYGRVKPYFPWAENRSDYDSSRPDEEHVRVAPRYLINKKR